jgi:hypothetical protein
VGEVINGGIRLLGINEGDLREEDKTWKRISFLFWFENF